MLGDQLGEDIGQITTTRVLPAENGMPRVEVSFEADGTMIGLHAHDMGTYSVTARPDGTMVGEGNGVLTAENGDVATWHGGGIGTQVRPGAFEWRGAIYYSTASESLAPLTRCAALFEFDTDESGKVTGRIFEWK